jgi:hypothetical protein
MTLTLIPAGIFSDRFGGKNVIGKNWRYDIRLNNTWLNNTLLKDIWLNNTQLNDIWLNDTRLNDI